MTKMETLQEEERPIPNLQKGGLFEFCPRDYWESLDAKHLTMWISGVSDYLCSDNIEEEELAFSLGEFHIDYTGSGRALHEFFDIVFEKIDLCLFLCWASQRLMLLETEQGRRKEDLGKADNTSC